MLRQVTPYADCVRVKVTRDGVDIGKWSLWSALVFDLQCLISHLQLVDPCRCFVDGRTRCTTHQPRSSILSKLTFIQLAGRAVDNTVLGPSAITCYSLRLAIFEKLQEKDARCVRRVVKQRNVTSIIYEMLNSKIVHGKDLCI
jgi:hypothetical protein